MSDKPIAQTVSGFEKFLVDHGFLNTQSFDQLQKIKPTANKGTVLSPGEISNLLLQQKLLDEEDVAKARAAFLNLPYIDLRKTQILPAVLNAVPEESRNFYHMVPFELEGKNLKVALADPGNLQALEALEFLGQKQNFQIHIYIASSTSLATSGGDKKNISRVVGEALQDIQRKEATQQPEVQFNKQQAAPQVIEDAPIIKIVDVILTNAIEANASDIHIEPSENDVRVRYRIDGILHTSLRLPRNVLSAIISRIKILCNLKIDEQRLPQDGRFHVDVANRSVDFRVSTLPLMYGEKVVMRILDKSGSVPTLDQLGIRGQGLAWIQENIKKTHGIFLITGPTGSGKSTTLYSILSILNTTAVNIITLEDPVEYFIQGVNQSQVNAEIGLTFASGLRSILRQDPNVIMVGEVRDQETAELAVQAALTGHLVFSTLHTNNAVGAVPRLIDMGIQPFLLSASVNLVMAQRLVRKLCEFCKVELPITPIEKQEIEKQLVSIPQDYFDKIDAKDLHMWGPKGCEKCGHTGYKGRFGIFEIMPTFTDLQELIFGQTQASKMYEAMLKKGMISMKQDGIIKVLRGETTLEEVVRVTTE
jgi:type IV pilus assembly protein PilB